MSKRKRPAGPTALTIALIMTVRVDPDEANVGSYTVGFDVDGPEAVVGIVRAAYQMGAMNRGIDAYIGSIVRALGPQAPTLSVSVGRA